MMIKPSRDRQPMKIVVVLVLVLERKAEEEVPLRSGYFVFLAR